MVEGYNAPARIDVTSEGDFFITASFIYWQPRQEGMELSYIDHASQDRNKSLIKMDFDYAPGFKVGFGKNCFFDNFNIYVEYTRLHSKTSSHHSVDTISFVESSWIDTEIAFTSINKISGSWRSDIDIVDLELSRSYYVGKNLTFKPYAGGRAFWLDQQYDLKFIDTDLIENSSNNKSDSWAIGTRAGIDTNWLFGSFFKLFGNAAGNIFYQHIKSEIYHVYYTPSTSILSVKNKIKYVLPNVEASLGLGFYSYLFNKKTHLDLSASYEFHYFWNQNFMGDLANTSNTANPHSDSGNLMFHGLSIEVKLDF